jgi:hypothetical protein
VDRIGRRSYLQGLCGIDNLIWSENCKIHHTRSIHDLYYNYDILDCHYPENMTAFLQPMDLVVNGPIKAFIRKQNCNRIIAAAFKVHKSKKTKGKFIYPKPTVADGIDDIMLLYRSQFRDDKFRKSINRCFIRTGSIKNEDDTQKAAKSE